MLKFSLEFLMGFFIVIDGGDGSGKDTQKILLQEYLTSLGFNVLMTAEPTYEGIGAEIRQILAGELPRLEALEFQKLMSEDREIHLREVIQPHLDNGGIVICARYLHSALAYGQADGVSLDVLWEINKDFILPNLTIYLSVDPKESLQRVASRIEKSGESLHIFEKLSIQKNVRKNFLDLQDDCREIVVVDAFGAKKDTHQLIINCVDEVLDIASYLIKVK